jgi:hypothetical protein
MGQRRHAAARHPDFQGHAVAADRIVDGNPDIRLVHCSGAVGFPRLAEDCFLIEVIGHAGSRP